MLPNGLLLKWLTIIDAKKEINFRFSNNKDYYVLDFEWDWIFARFFFNT